MTKSLIKFGRSVLHRLAVTFGAVGLTLAFFLVLPLMQAINAPLTDDLIVQSVDTATIAPPPPPPEEEEKKEEEKEEKPPELTEEAPPLSLDQLDLLLNSGLSDGLAVGDFAIKLNTVAGGGGDDNALFTMADLDQRPRIIYQPSPAINEKLRRKAPGTVYVIFIVNEQGRVEQPTVQQSTDSIFNTAALNAIKKWKFEPGKRNGKAVRFRMRIPITFPKG